MYRIKKLRTQALENTISYDEFFYKFYKYYDSAQNTSKEDRYANAFYFAFSNLTPSISEDELIVGKGECRLSFTEEDEWRNKYIKIAHETSANAGGGQDSHLAIDYELVLNCGLNGIIEKIDAYLLICDESKKAFYLTCRKCLEAVIKHSECYADVAREMAKKESSENRRKELEKISDICKKVPANPAESFYEAVQSVHFITYCLSMNPFRYCYQQFQLGHTHRCVFEGVSPFLHMVSQS